MIHSRITAKAQTTVPIAVRRALGVATGDELQWELDGDKVVVRRVLVDNDDDMIINSFALFTEWADELDSVYDNL